MTEAQLPQTVRVIHDIAEIATPVEFKVTKTDLIDTLIQEEEDRLDTLHASLEAQLKTLQERRKTIEEEGDKKALELARQRLGSRLTALETVLGSSLDVTVDGHATVYLDQNIKKRHRYNSPYIEIPSRFLFETEDDSSSIQLWVTLKKEEVQKHYDLPAIRKVMKDCEPITEELRKVQEEINNLEKKGSRAKAQLVKDILARTEQGKLLLGQMDKAKKLYIDGKKK